MFFISLAEATYVVYMLNYYKTTKNLSHCTLEADYFKHPVGDSLTPMSFICEFGGYMSWGFAAYLLGRHAFRPNKKVNSIVLVGGVAASLLNANVFIYLLPVFIIESLFTFAQ